MGIEAEIVGEGRPVKVTESGELVVAPLTFSAPEFNSMGTSATAFNFFIPRPGKQVVLTGMLASGNKDINASTAAVVDIYEAANSTTTTISKSIFQLDVPRNGAVNATGLNALVLTSEYVNAKSDQATVRLTLLGYYINEVTDVTTESINPNA